MGELGLRDPGRGSAALVVASVAACNAVDLTTLRYSCQADRDCPPTQTCQSSVCAPLGSIDAGLPPAPSYDCYPPSSAPATERWWCTGIQGSDLTAFAAAEGALVIDLHPDGPSFTDHATFTAVLARDDGSGSGFFVDTAFRNLTLDQRHSVVQSYHVAALGEPLYAGITGTSTGVLPWSHWVVGARTETIANYVTVGGERLVSLRPSVLDLQLYDFTTLGADTPRGRLSSYLVDASTSDLQRMFRSGDHLVDVALSGATSYLVVTEERLATDRPQIGQYGLDADALNMLLMSRGYLPDRVCRSPSEPAFAAIVSLPPANATERLEARLGDSTDRSFEFGVTTLSPASTSSGADTASGLAVPFDPGASIVLVLAAGALRAVEHGTLTLDTSLAVHTTTKSGGCGIGISYMTEPLSYALPAMLARADRLRAFALIEALDPSALPGLVADLGLASTAIDPSLSCPGSPGSRTTIADQLSLYRALEGGLLTAEHQQLLFSGLASDRAGLSRAIRRVVRSEGRRFGWATARADRFWARLSTPAIAGADDLTVGGVSVSRRSIAGVLNLAACSGAVRSDRKIAFALALEDQRLDQYTTELATIARADGEGELLREPLRAAIAAGDACF
jgi:hypothetical protein